MNSLQNLKKSILLDKGGGDTNINDREKKEKQFKRELEELKPFKI